jgi:polar amino acid transport system substrate-binding protein
MQNKTITLLLLLVLALSCTPRKAPQRLSVGVDATWAPLEFGNQTAYVNGFVEDLLLEIAKEKQVVFEKVNVGSDALLQGLHEKKYDAVLTSMSPYNYNLAKYDFSQNFLDLGLVLITEKNSPAKLLDDLKGEFIGVILSSQGEDFLQNYPEVGIRTFDQIPPMLDALVAGDISGALLENIPAVNYVEDLYQEQLKIAHHPMTKKGLHMIAPRQNEGDVVEVFNSGLIRLKRSKKFKEMLKKWSL